MVDAPIAHESACTRRKVALDHLTRIDREERFSSLIFRVKMGWWMISMVHPDLIPKNVEMIGIRSGL